MKKGVKVALQLFVGIPVLIVLGIVVTGFVTSTLWGWFVVPLGATAISVAHAAGLATLLRWLTFDITTQKIEMRTKKLNSPKEQQLEKWVAYSTPYIFGPLVFLLFGWIAQLFM